MATWEEVDEEQNSSPSAVDVEKAVLGMMFLRETVFYEAIAVGLIEDYFALDSHRRIFLSINRLVDARKTPDIVTVCNELEAHKDLKRVGDSDYVASLVDGVLDCGSVKQYIEILREKYLRRRMIKLSLAVVESAKDLSSAINWTVSGLQDDLLRLQGDVTHEGYSISEFDGDVLATVKEQMHSAQEIVGLPFGLRELDEITTGMREGDFIPLGGYPASGKTAFACNVARINAQRGTAVGFFSIEMLKDQLLHRFWAQASDISYSKLRNPKNLHRQELLELETKWMPEVRKWPIKIDDSVKDIKEIIPKAHLWVRRYGVKLIIVDFLQRIHAPGEKEYEIVSYAADALTEFAKMTKISVLCLSQLARAEDKKNASNVVPNMQMLRSSGRIEQNANLVLFTHRPEDDKGQPTGEDLIVVGKQRAGIKGRVKAYFHGTSQRWEERDSPQTKPATMFEGQS